MKSLYGTLHVQVILGDFQVTFGIQQFWHGRKEFGFETCSAIALRADQFGSLRGSSPVKSQVGNGLAQKSFQKPSSPFLGASRPPGVFGKVPQSLFRRGHVGGMVAWWAFSSRSDGRNLDGV